jgi:hypothetical protein
MTTQERPLYVLPGIGQKLELYNDRVILRNTGFFSRLFGEVARTVAIRDINQVMLYEGSMFINGCLRLFVKQAAGKLIILVYPRKHNLVARTIKDALNDRVGRTDILPYIRSLR